jgi:hypothetical protein
VDGNSPKPTETTLMYLSALNALLDWLRREGGNKRIPLALEILAERTAATLEKGHSSPEMDADSLRMLFYAAHGGVAPDAIAGRWLARREVTNWWNERQRQIEEACRDTGCEWMPTLMIKEGGGRGNPTAYWLDFAPIPAMDDHGSVDIPSNDVSADARSTIRYILEPAVAAWWVRGLLGKERFRMRSARGIVLVCLVATPFLMLALFWLAVFLTLRLPRPITTADITLLLVATLSTSMYWKGLKPLVRLAHDRVTIASDIFLSMNQMHGQFRMSRDAGNKLAGGWFSVVRHWAYCPVCSGEVEVRPGGESFPGRLVGRCSDSPLEHVYSFDPVSFTGNALVQSFNRH